MKSAPALIALVREIIDDTGTTDSAVVAWMNEILNIVAERITPTTLMVPFKAAEIYADEDSVDLPDDCVPEKVLAVHNSDRKPIKLHFRIEDAEEDFRFAPAEDTQIRSVLVMGNALRIIPKQSTDTTIYLSYVQTPVVFSGTTDTGVDVNFLPQGLAEKLVVNYAAAMAYRIIEDGVTDKRLNFQLYLGMAKEAFAEIEEYFAVRSKQGQPETVRSALDQVADNDLWRM